jgi:GxxExxY protein
MNDLQKDPLTDKIIGCAIEVHKCLGPGLLESMYESALCMVFELSALSFQRQVLLPLKYRDRLIGDFRLFEKAVVLELKSLDRMDAVCESQLLSYLKLSSIKTGLLINFNSRPLRDGIKRFVL